MKVLTLNEKVAQAFEYLTKGEPVEIYTDRGEMYVKKNEDNTFRFNCNGMMRSSGGRVGTETIKDRLEVYLDYVTVTE